MRILNALSNEGLALHNASTGLDDGPDRLGRQPLAKACAQVLKEIETPHTSFTCSVTTDRRMWKKLPMQVLFRVKQTQKVARCYMSVVIQIMI